MPQPDVVLIRGAASLDDVRRILDGVSTDAEVFENDYVNEPGLPDLESYDYLVDVRGKNQASEAAVIEKLAAQRGWRTLWLQDGNRVVAQHPAAA